MSIITMTHLISYFFYFILFNFSYCELNLSSANTKPTTVNDIDNDLQEVSLSSDSNLYFLTVGLGSPSDQRMVLLIDTQHKELSVMSKNCTVCKEINTYDETKSKTFIIDSMNKTVYMNNVEFHGRSCHDQLLVSDSIARSQYPFVLVDEITHTTNNKFEGYFGLGFTKNKMENFVYNLKSKGLIKEAVYSLLLLSPGEESKLYLGGYNSKLINATDAEKIIYTDVLFNQDQEVPQIEWYIASDSIYLNSMNIPQSQKIVLNSGSNILRMPKSFFFENIKNIFNKNSQCQMGTDNVFHCKCGADYQTKFPTFKFSLNNGKNNLTITPDDYTVLDISSNLSTDSSAYCVLYLSLNYANDYWLLGNNFINNYYTIYDVENSKIGFYDIKNITIGSIQDILMLSIIIASCSILFFLIVHCIYKKYLAGSTRQNALLPN